jgi:hypothetical protein
MRSAALLGVLLGIIAMPAISEGMSEGTPADAFFGTWALVADHSHYERESPPQQMILTIESAPYGLAYRSETHYGDGRKASSQFVARFDQTPVLVVGNAGFLAPVALSISSDGGIDAVYTSGIKKVAWSHWSIQGAGEDLLITTVYLGAQGQHMENVVAFHRIERPTQRS